MTSHKLKIPEIQINPAARADQEAICRVLAADGRFVRIRTVNWPQYPSSPRCGVYVGHSDAYLWLMFEGIFNDFRITVGDDLAPVANDNCFEAFLAGVDRKEYWNFEFNASGACNASHRQRRDNPTRLTRTQLARIIRWSEVTSRVVHGARKTRWRLLAGIPLSLPGLTSSKELRANFYACSSKNPEPYYLSWAPIESDIPDFHRPEFFGQLTLL